ncbi:putative GTP-binding protein EngB [Labeo rohita]|uniref:GTP-binding protein EngB n=1 Tax=Labeo rohita TaxID=84645 RepID=A0ABQ8MN37_LABRO|nr:putative GTP-binding protein EngB [Labeo rohita]
MVILKPRHGYVPKVLSTPFRAQVVTLLALPIAERVWPLPGHGLAGFLLMRFVRPLAGRRCLPLPDSITWTYLPI